MAAVASTVHVTPLTSATSRHETRSISVHNSTNPQSFPQPTYNPTSRYNGAFTNWQNFNTNNSINATFSGSTTMPSPPSTLSSASSRTSPTSSPLVQPANRALDSVSPVYFNSPRARSKSMAIPVSNPCCPNCGLRRPSIISDQTISPISGNTGMPIRHRPHLPLHLHCPEPCPDTVLPSRSSNSPTSPYKKQRHHRRRSSLCYAESLVEDAGVMDGGNLPADLKQTWEKHAQNIARKIMLRKPSPDSALAFEDAILEDD